MANEDATGGSDPPEGALATAAAAAAVEHPAAKEPALVLKANPRKTLTANTLDEAAEAILKQHRASAQNRDQQRLDAGMGVSTTVASLTKTLEEVNKIKAAQSPVVAEVMARLPPTIPATNNATTTTTTKRKLNTATLPKSKKPRQSRASPKRGTFLVPAPFKAKPPRPNKWGIPSTQELSKPFFDTIQAISYLQEHGVLCPPPESCPRCFQPCTIKNNNHSRNCAPEWRCRKGACMDLHQNKEWRKPFFYGSFVHHRARSKPLSEILQLLYFWCVLGVKKHHTTGVNRDTNGVLQHSNLYHQMSILLGWTHESVMIWTRRLRTWVSQYGLTDTSHGKKLGGPNTIVELGMLPVPSTITEMGQNDDKTLALEAPTKFLLAGIERNSHGNYFVVRDYQDTTLEKALEKWVKPNTLVQTREADGLEVPDKYRHETLEPLVTINQKRSMELPKLYEDIWRRQNEANLWFALLDLLKLLRLAHTVKMEEQQQEENNNGTGKGKSKKDDKQQGENEGALLDDEGNSNGS